MIAVTQFILIDHLATQAGEVVRSSNSHTEEHGCSESEVQWVMVVWFLLWTRISRTKMCILAVCNKSLIPVRGQRATLARLQTHCCKVLFMSIRKQYCSSTRSSKLPERIILGIESSFDDTGVALISSTGSVLGEVRITQGKVCVKLYRSVS